MDLRPRWLASLLGGAVACGVAFEVLAGLGCARAEPLHQDAEPLFVDVATPEGLSISDPVAALARVVTVNFDALEQQGGPGSGLSGTATAVILNLFPDVELTAVLDEASGSMGNPGERLTWIGHVDGSPENRVLLIAGDGTLAGSVQTKAGQYEIRTLPTDPAYHLVAQIDQGRFNPD